MTALLGSRLSVPALNGSSPTRLYQRLDRAGRNWDSDRASYDWRLKLDPTNEGVERGWHERGLPADAVPAEVPGVWNTTFPGYTGVAWYECRFQQRFIPGGAVRLVIGGANYLTDAWLNGVYLGRHEGGYDAFSFRCSHLLRDDANRLTLRIVDPPPDGEIDGLRLRETPTAKESWYGGAGGPWGAVWLEHSAKTWVQEVRVQAELATGRVTLHATIASDLPEACDVRAIACLHPTEHPRRIIAESASELSCKPDGTRFSITLNVPDPQTWSPESPVTYIATVELVQPESAGGQGDSVSVHFGFRTAEFRDGVFHLNGEPRFIKGALLQPTYPRSLILPPGQIVRSDLEAAQHAGLNMIRVHLRPPPLSLLTLADRMGMMLYVEPPLAWIEPSGRLLEHGKRELAALVRACGNHPSVVLWGIFNENAAASEAAGADLMAELATLDPTRPIIENSGGAAVGEIGMWAWGGQSRCWSPGWDAPRPLNDVHVYLANPLRADARNLLASLGDGPTVNVTPGRTPAEQIESRLAAEPVLVSEFGCGALPDFDQELAAFDGESHLADAILLRELRDSLHAGLSVRGLIEETGDVPALVRQTQALQAEGILAHSTALRRNRHVSGLIVTQLADAGWEQMAGLTGLWRQPRPALDALKQALQPRLLHIEPADPCSTGEVTVRVWLIEEPGLSPLTGPAVLSVSVDGHPALPALARRVRIPAGRGQVARLTVHLPDMPGRYRLRATLQIADFHGEASAVVSRLPAHTSEDGAGLVLLGQAFRRLLPAAHPAVPADWRGPILADLYGSLSVDRTIDAMRAARAGAHLVLAGMNPYWAQRIEAMLPLPVAVHGARGNFMGMHHWRRRHPVFEPLGEVGGPGLADGTWAETLPTWALDELPGAAVLAGCFTVPDGGRGFLWRATVQTIPYGDGRLTFWQLPLGERRGGVLGGHLLHALVRWLTHTPQ